LARSPGRTRAILALGLKAGVVNLVALVNYRVELFLLEAYHGLGQVGVYSLSVSLAELVWLLSASLSTVAVAPTVNLEEREAVDVVAQTVRHSLILTAVFGTALGAVGIFAVPLVYGRPFAGAVGPLLLLIPGIVAYSPASVLSAYFSMRKGLMRYPMIVAGTSAAVNALLCIGLVPHFGAKGAAVASTGGYVVGSGLLLAMFFKVARTSLVEVVPTAADLAAYRNFAFSLRARLSR
jgi:O-antigen/teichoic acid export membrane protein